MFGALCKAIARRGLELLQEELDGLIEVELLREDVILPKRAYDDDAGIDFFSPVDIKIPACGDVRIGLGLIVKFPKGNELRLCDKSGVAWNKKLSVCGGCVDHGYTGEVTVHLRNHSDKEVSISKNEKIVQGVLVKISMSKVKRVECVDDNTKRGDGAYGSTNNV